MFQDFPKEQYPQIKFVIGDIRDKFRLNRVLSDVDYVIHTAAMKYVETAELNPDECIKTNIGGAENLVEACLNSKVERVVALSTDKACAPVSLYGATKLTSDKLFIAANNLTGDKDLKFSVVRFGNILGSSGSVVPYFLKKKVDGVLPITHPDMTRFTITLDKAVEMVMKALKISWGGELFVPKIKSYNIMDLANAICPECKKEIIGIRPGEKLHEQMISPSDSSHTYDMGNYYTIVPNIRLWDLNDYIKRFNAKVVSRDFSYSSDTNDSWEGVNSLKKLISKIT
ncbi:MAG: polysaccharide biosynthesis protein, partial [Flavobacteriaceae bacterium]|nr:polysaccharide biosynthesis protein [Flavobacteriaceae bacterium]